MGRFLVFAGLAVAIYLVLTQQNGATLRAGGGGAGFGTYAGSSGSAIQGVKQAAGGILR